MDFRAVGLNTTISNKYIFTAFPMSNVKNVLPVVPSNWNRVHIDTPARVSGRPAITPFQEERVL